MGVHGLWRLLESTGKPINPETLEGKILAVDISIWLNQAVKGVRDREGNSVQNAHLLTLFHRICKLLFFRIRPVFVFDGDAPLLKKQTLALRRQRKEEFSRESRQTNEKLLKTFLKRQAIKAALGDSSKDPLPSLSSVRRDEVDDMYVLPALPVAEENDKSSSEEEEEKEWEDMVDSFYTYQGESYEDPNTVDINSEEFASLPPEMKHEILKEMKEFSKRRRTMYHKPPEQSGDFSQYQLAGLLQRNRLNQRLEGVEKEMNQRSAGSAPHLCQPDGDQQNHSVESQRLVSEDHSHYILIKGSAKNETAPESQHAAAPWSGCKRGAADRPKPLWRPVCEEEEDKKGTSSKNSISSVSKQSEGDTSPPSPRTLKAIQSALNNSSDEEMHDQDKKDGSVSPQTLLAIQQVLAEEEDTAAEHRTLISSSATKLPAHIHHSAPQVVISSSEEETESDMNSLPNEKLDIRENPIDQTLHVKDYLFVSSSEDEMEEVVGQRNKAFRFAALQQPHERETDSKGGTEKGKLREDIRTGSRGQAEKQEELEKKESEHRLSTKNRELIQTQGATASSQNTQLCGKPLSPERKTKTHHLLPEQRSNEPIRALEQRKGDGVKSEDSGESESEESFIEVSEDEFKQEGASDALVIIKEKGSPTEVQDDVTKKKEKPEESWTEAPAAAARKLEEEEDKTGLTEEKELTEGTQSSSVPAFNEWEDLEVDELEAMESSLQLEQNNLREQKQQQERMANTVTGQMCLESQELLQLFGVPFLVAPMEAEAQCAALDRADQTHGTITDDSDVWLFGGRHVYKNFFSQNKYVEHYDYSDLQNQLGLDRAKLINLAYLLGSDYTEGVPGVGCVTGMEILNEFPGPGLEPLKQFSKWWSEAQEKKHLVADPRDTKVKKKLRDLRLQPGFPNPAVVQAYLEPAVDQSDSSFSWGHPQLDMIKDFCLSHFGWSSQKTEETLRPVIKQLSTQQTQLRIDSFFRMEQQEKKMLRSQRLRRAVTCLKRKEREGGEEKEEDSEVEMHSPSKSKKGKTASKKPKKGGAEKEEERSMVGGGFLASEVIVECPVTLSLKDASSTSQEFHSVKADTQSTKTVPLRVTKSNSSSSGEDSDGGGEVAMVTARSVFESSRRGHRVKSTRGRRSTSGQGRGKKL
uniref:Excision repair cross-complementation group 5 n=1 Tax=Monopterus albus TaxID=43700 RepID=A0A3Q3K4U1_MONAL|nr:DNA repair protein complementing XP-G cells [Monopterus albus]XP_020461548.1 DNA repair protein complementing XP-G cells [Monopterus albus]XP_020461554.1 DNA repair protein complementing XP-G cells [Monopterus albus]